jgi:pyrimidine deaminase RibD-like protein
VESDVKFMKRALELAARGAGLVSPNPMVGAVIVSDGEIVGEGHHLFRLLRHAESYALEAAGNRARGATLYCNLEPCCHHGRTPPCTDGVIQAGIARAIIAIADPDRRVSGRGLDQMRSAGIAVEAGLCEKEAMRLNESYLKFITTRRPFIHAVVACQDLVEEPGGGGVPLGVSLRNTTDQLVAPQGVDETGLWEPSDALLQQAARVDGLVLGDYERINRAFLECFLDRAWHRSPIVAGASEQIRPLRGIIGRHTPRNISLFEVESDPDWLKTESAVAPDSRTDAAGDPQHQVRDEGANVVRAGDGAAGPVVFMPLLDYVAESNATSLMALPVDGRGPSLRSHADKLTFVTGGEQGKGSEAATAAFCGKELEDIETNQAGSGFMEITGYAVKQA